MSPLDRSRIETLAAIAGDDLRAAHSMPGWYYNDPAIFEQEKSSLFADGWACAGHASEIASPGQYMAVKIGDEPVVVVRDRQGDVRAYSNVCRHRGMALVTGKGKAAVLTRPYHAWSYDLTARCARRPIWTRSRGSIPPPRALPEFALEEWRGLLFVNTGNNAPPLALDLVALEFFVANYRIEARHSTETWFEEWARTEVAGREFHGGLHLSVTHATTLDSITPTELCEKLATGKGFTAYRSNYRDTATQREPFPEELTAQERRSSVLFNVYPNFVITAGPNCAVPLILFPETPETVNIKMGILVQEGADDLPETEAYINLAHEFNAEDRMMLEAVQKNSRSAHRPPSPLAPEALEGTIWDFTRHVARHLTGHAGGAVS